MIYTFTEKCLYAFVCWFYIFIPTALQAKESWEMNTCEKLEQSAIVKEKGTQYFKVRKQMDPVMCIINTEIQSFVKGLAQLFPHKLAVKKIIVFV